MNAKCCCQVPTKWILEGWDDINTWKTLLPKMVTEEKTIIFHIFILIKTHEVIQQNSMLADKVGLLRF